MRRAWVPAAVLLAAVALQIGVWTYEWTPDTRNHPRLQSLRVQSGQQLAIERPQDKPDQPIVDYQTPAGHSHRVRIYMKRARLSSQSRDAFGQVGLPAPKGNGVLEVGPDPKFERIRGEECQIGLLVSFPNRGASSVLLYPQQPGESPDADDVRIIHLQSNSELAVRFSANSSSGQHGPRCRSVLTMRQDEQVWTIPLGMDWEWTFLAAPDFDIRITFAPDLWTGEGDIGFGQELQSLALEPTQPQRLALLPVGGSRVLTSRERAGQPLLTAKSLKLGPNFLDVGIEGKVGIPLRESLEGWQWAAAFGVVDLPLLAWLVAGLRRRDRVFLSYSRGDEAKVMEVYNLLDAAGAKPWIDRKNIPGGARWRALIEREMRRSRKVLVFLSEHSVKTGGYFWMEMEIAVSLAEDRKSENFLIPLKLEACQLPDVLVPYNALALFEPGGQEKLVAALGLEQRKRELPTQDTLTTTH